MIGARLGPYEIVAPLGAGGMGEVYRARDTRLGREVAVKLLRAEVASDAERVRRFEQEARAVASLSHPNILALYDVGSHEGRPYLVTELLEGQTLEERIASGGLTVTKSVELATQIANGLAAAHEHGIVHRDLKPGNVFITRDGVIKILDFGLARLTQSEGGASWASGSGPVETALTRDCAILGTFGYMAPEQVRGRPADHRSDIFGFGCLLHEMLFGISPFRRDTAAETIAAVLHDQPPDLAPRGENLPPRLEAVIRRCLEKSPDDRFQSARDLAHDLGAALAEANLRSRRVIRFLGNRRREIGLALGAVGVLVAAWLLVYRVVAPARGLRSGAPPRIIVLPFENLGLPEDEYFAAGMTEEITSRLATVQGLRVISRTTAVGYDREGKTVEEIGRDLGVDYVLEGSVRWERIPGRESRVRITPQLVRVADDTHVWADRYDRVIADVFDIQSEVAENVVSAMGVALLPREQAALDEVSTNDLAAYQLYLRGLENVRGGQDATHVEGALRMYQAAVDRDPRFAQAWAALARCHLMMHWLHYDRSEERLRRAKEAAERATGLRPDLAESRCAIGWYYYHGLLDYPRAFKEFETAVRIQPNNSEALYGMGAVLRRQGHWAEAAKAIGKSLELDPRNTSLLFNFGETCVLARRYAEADDAFGSAISWSPSWGDTHAWRARLHFQWHGDLGRAQAILDEARRTAGITDDSACLAELQIRVCIARGDFDEALRNLEVERREVFSNQWFFLPIELLRGQVLNLAGQHDAARRSFDAARSTLERNVREDPDDARFHSSLGIAYAELGRADEAVREGRLGYELMPASKDAWRAMYRLEDLAVVYAIVGRHGEAIAHLDELLARSGWFTAHALRLDPRWDPLRSDPRFQALLAKYEVKE